MLRWFVFGIIGLLTTACIDGAEGIFIRVQNDGPVAIDEVQLGGQHFVQLEVDQTSSYTAVTEAYTTPNYTVVVGEKEVSVNFLVPGDPLGDGFYTYHISFEQDNQGNIVDLDLSVTKD